MEVNIKLSESTQPQTSTRSLVRKTYLVLFHPVVQKQTIWVTMAMLEQPCRKKVTRLGTGCQLKSKQSNNVNQYDLSL